MRCVRRLPAGIVAIVVLAFTPAAGFAQTSAACEATAYGVSTSLSDNTAALVSALQACRGRTLHVSAGIYRFSPGQFIGGIVIPDATSIVGDGAGATVLQITGPGNYDSFFWIRNVSNVAIRGLTLEGNGQPYQAGSCTYDYGRAISIASDTGRGGPVTNVSIASNYLHNFVGSGWIWLYAAPGSPGIGTIPAGANISIEGNFFQSAPGNAIVPNNENCNAGAVQIFGADTVPNIVNVSVAANGFETSYLKQGIIVYGSSSQVTITANSISATGQKLPDPRDHSLYGVLIYQKALPPNTINVVGNRILDPFSCGVYVAAGRNITIDGNRISGQVDTADDIEPKGAICLNQIDNGHDGEPATILGNTITNSHVGIAIAEGLVPNVRQNSISQIPAGGVGIKLTATASTSISLIDNSIVTQEKNVSGLIGVGAPASLAIENLFSTGVVYPIRWYHDPSGAQAYCHFADVGSIRSVFGRRSSDEGFRLQAQFSAGCN